MALEDYKAKRKFESTPEPEGKKAAAGDRLRFVVHKHAASRLHYDLRLEIDGVYRSWAVPKGPSLNPGDKRLAMMVEDHPIDYGNFEGTIPKGNYGAGTVMIWDKGTFTDDPTSKTSKEMQKNLLAGLKKGDMKFNLDGKKLHGSFVLVKIKNSDEDNAWLLIKHRDEWAMEEDITELDKSVETGRSMEEIAKGESQWISKPPLDLTGAPTVEQPQRLQPMLATLEDKPFDDPKWLYEIKWDGYRILSLIKDGKVTLKSRNDQDYTKIFHPIAEELKSLHFNCILDGEIVVLDNAGRASFGALQNYQRTGEGSLVYYVFDAPYADGRDLRSLPLEQRKEVAYKIIEKLENVRFSDHVWEKGQDFFKLVTDQKIEGMVAKDSTSTYQAGRRSRSWLKFKTQLRQEAVIGGFTEPKGSRKHLGSLLLGVYDEQGYLQPVGSSGGGMDESELKRLYELLKPLEQNDSPFANEIKTLGKPRWVKPKYLAEVAFSEWTEDKQMRHPVYLGLRSDKKPSEVAIDMPQKSKPTNPSTTKSSEPQLTNLDKIFFPEDKISKGDLIKYYESMADIMMPYLKDRPQSLNRHPNGIHGESFYQKNLEKHPEWVRTEPIFSEHNNDEINWLICNDRETLLYMVNLGCIEIHPWHSRLQHLENPDYCLIDLDAKDSDFETVIKVAQETHKLLEELGIESYPKTSGKTGLHILIPLGAKYDYEQSKIFAQILVNKVHERIPKLTSVERTPKKRQKGAVYLDYLQNRKGQTMAVPYCARPVSGAPVSTPLKWSEVKKGLKPTKFNIGNIHNRVKKNGDLLEGLLSSKIDLMKVIEKLNSAS